MAASISAVRIDSGQQETSQEWKPSSDEAADLGLEKIHLAAAHRLAALHELDEGIDNHFTVTVPGNQNQYLILPFGCICPRRGPVT